MARRGLGMTALRAALGAVSGGLEGAQQAEALRRKQKLEEENAAFSRASVLSSLGLRPTMVRDTEDPAARNVVSLEQPSFAPRGSSSALASALQQGMGVDTSARSLSKPTTMSTANPLTTALDTATTRMKDFERQQSSLPANPAMQMQLPGVGRIGFRGPETEEEKRTERLADIRAEKDVELGYQEKTINTERERMRGVYRGAYPTATEQEINGMVNGIKADDMGLEILTPSQKKAQTRQESIDALDRQFKLAQIEKMKKDGDDAKPLQPQELARLSEASSNAITAGEKMDAIEKDWKARKPNIGALDVGAVQELMEGKGISLSKAVASVWGSGFNPLSTDPQTMQQLQDYMSYAKMHSNAIRLIAARGGSNLLQQTEQQLVNAAWAGGQLADIERAQLARNTITESLQDALDASGVSIKLRRAAEQRQFNNNVPSNPLAGSSAKAATEDPDFTAAKAAIAAGKDRNAVIQRYESSGKKWPGGA